MQEKTRIVPWLRLEGFLADKRTTKCIPCFSGCHHLANNILKWFRLLVVGSSRLANCPLVRKSPGAMVKHALSDEG